MTSKNPTPKAGQTNQCCGENMQFNDNSITQIKNPDNGCTDMQNIYHCPICETYYEADVNEAFNGMDYYVLTKREVKQGRYDTWFTQEALSQLRQIRNAR